MRDIQTIKVLVVDHHVLVGSGVSAILRDYPDFEVVGQAGSGEESLRLFEQHAPDVVALDIDLPGNLSGMEVIRRLHGKSAQTRIVVLTNLLEELLIREALQGGALSYLLKNTSAEGLAQAIRAAYVGQPTLSPEVTQLLIQVLVAPNGQAHLTPREHQVLELIARGWNNQEIARELSISLSTVQFHVSNIFVKLKVHNRIEAATFAVRHQFPPYPSQSPVHRPSGSDPKSQDFGAS